MWLLISQGKGIYTFLQWIGFIDITKIIFLENIININK